MKTTLTQKIILGVSAGAIALLGAACSSASEPGTEPEGNPAVAQDNRNISQLIDDYVEESDISEDRLVEQVSEYALKPEDEVRAVIKEKNIDFNKEALDSAISYKETFNKAPDEVRVLLMQERFSEDNINYALENM